MATVSFALFSIFIPVILGCFSFSGKKYSRNLMLGSITAITFCSNAVMVLVWFLLASVVTQYELLFVNTLVSILLAFLFLPVFRKETISPSFFLKVSCLLVMALVVYSNLTFGQTGIHADASTASLLTRAQLRHRDFFPDTWYYGNGDIWVFSSQTFTAPFVMLLKNQSLARMLGSSLLCCATAGAIYFHNKKGFGSNAWMIAIPLLFLFISGERDMIMYEAAYLTQMLLMSVVPFLGYKVYKNTANKWTHMVFYLILIILMMGGIRFMAEQILPVWCTCIVLIYAEIRNREEIDWKGIFFKCVRFSVSILLPAIVGLAIYVLLKRTHNVVYSANGSIVFNNSIKACLDTVSVYIFNLFFCFGFTGNAYLISVDGILNMISVIMCLLVMVVVPVLQARKLKEESEYVQYFFVFAVIHNILMFVMIVLFVAKTNTQYVLTSIFANMIVSARYIYVYWIRQKHFEKYIWTALFLFASLVGCVDVVSDSIGWEEKVLSKKAVQQQLVDRGLTKGYGEFWTVYGQELYSDFQIQYGGLSYYDGIPTKFVWLVDATVFEPEDKDTFLILSDYEHKDVAPNIPSLFEEPIDYFVLDGYHVYVFDYDITVDIS